MTLSKHLSIGALGEEIACRYLKDRGFTIKDRNYRKKWGEIDIVSQKHGVTHFVEVKSCETGSSVDPAENLHEEKIKKLFRVFESYALERNTSLRDTSFEWQFDAAIVRINTATKEARVKYFENLVAS